MSFPASRFIPRIANMQNTVKMMMRMLSIPFMESPKALMMIFMLMFLEMIFKGLSALRSLIIFRFTVFGVQRSMTMVTTMMKSSLSHPLSR